MLKYLLLAAIIVRAITHANASETPDINIRMICDENKEIDIFLPFPADTVIISEIKEKIRTRTIISGKPEDSPEGKAKIYKDKKTADGIIASNNEGYFIWITPKRNDVIKNEFKNCKMKEK